MVIAEDDTAVKVVHDFVCEQPLNQQQGHGREENAPAAVCLGEPQQHCGSEGEQADSQNCVPPVVTHIQCKIRKPSGEIITDRES